jgi:hypothetical protein
MRTSVRRHSMMGRLSNLRCAATVTVTAAALLVPLSAHASPDPSLTDRSIRAVRAVVPPVIDGVLDDACWSECERASDFFDAERAATPTQPTEVRVSFDDDYLYVAFDCYEERMGAISAAITQRDAGGMFEVDDCVAVMLDTYHDQRSCYTFATNIAGAKLDMRVAESGNTQEIAWDAVWDVAARRCADRWTAEFAIPVAALRFVPGESLVWGAEFARNATPSREMTRWIHREGDVLNAAYYGDLSGMSFATAPRNLDVTASAVGRYDEADIHDYPMEPEDAEWDVHPDAGLDVKWVPLPTLTVSGTLNPDFAQIEGDPNQINLTGDELYLEERRPFFSEGMELFQTPLTILYTRRMEDIGYGGKAGGKFGATSFGALYALSDDLPRTANADVITDEYGNPLPPVESDYVALALRQDVMGSATLGGYYAGRERSDTDYSRVGALTLNAPAFGHGRVTGMAARSFNPGDVGADDAYWVGLDYERAQYQFEGSFEWIGEEFAPETGFVGEDRRGRVGGGLEVGRDFEIGGERVDDMSVHVYGNSFEGIDGGREVWSGGGVLSTVFQNKLNLTLSGTRAHDEVDYPEYPESLTGSLALTTNLGAWSGYIVGATVGDYHNSTYYSANAVACVQPHERLTIDMRANGVALRDYQDIDWVVERLRSDWLISRSSFVRLIAQGAQMRFGMEGGDYRSQQYDLNLLYGWEFHPGSMFYLAYNQTVERQGDENDYLDPVLVAKVTYLFSL